MADDLQRKIIAKVYSRVSAVVMGLCDEGDRVYFGTSNDADILRDLRDEWDAHKIMGEDILSSEQEVAALRVRVKSDADRITALQAQNCKLVEALKRAKSALKPFADRVFNDNGDCTVTDTHLLKPEDFCAADIVTKAIRAAIAEAEKGEG